MSQETLVTIENRRASKVNAPEIGGARVGNNPANYFLIAGFCLVSVLPLAFVWITMRSLAAITLRDDTYSHIPLIPIVSSFLIYLERNRIFCCHSSDRKIGAALLLAGAACFALTQLDPRLVSSNDGFSLAMTAVVLAWAGSFALFFGAGALRAATFPFLFLGFMIPIPELLLNRTIFLLQSGSADASGWIFNIWEIPVFRQGFDFALPGVVIRVAEECSGIRSTLALVIVAVLAGHFFLRSFWKTVLLCVLVFPVSIFKNGLRIVTLSTLAAYVNPGFLHGNLHRYGGVVFFVVGLAPLVLSLALLRKVTKGS